MLTKAELLQMARERDDSVAIAIEHLAAEIREGCKEIAQAVEKLAEAIEDHVA